HHQLLFHNPAHADAVGDFFGGRQHLATEFHFAAAQCPATPRVAAPAEEKTNQLPHRIKAQTTRHYRIAFKMAGKEPQRRINIQFGDDFTFTVFTTFVTDVGNAVHHQHI